jgi:hypothetical protein
LRHQHRDWRGLRHLVGVESLVGSPKNDALTGSEANNSISGGGGSDALGSWARLTR